MTQAKADLLALACDRIRDLDRPAYIKDHLLRYVAVNTAYACLFSGSADAFAGMRSHGERAALEVREAIERNALLLDDEAAVEIRGPDGLSVGVATIEPFVTEEGAVYIFGQMPTSAGVATAGKPVETDDLAAVRKALEAHPEPIRVIASDGRVIVENRASREGKDAGNLSAAPSGDNRGIKQSVENALELLDVGIAVFSADDRLIYRNGKMEKLYGPVVGPLADGLALSDFFRDIHAFGLRLATPDAYQKMPESDVWVAQKLAQCNESFLETTEQACDGRWLRCLNRRLENGLLLLVRLDVSDLKQQEMLLRQHVQQNELYHSIIQELPVAAFARDRSHRMIFANAAFGRLFGREPEALLGRTETECYGEAGKVMYANNERVMSSGKASSLEEDLSHSSGRQFSAISRTSRVETEDGEHYVVGSIIDISELKSREEALREAQGRAESLSHDLSGILSALPAGVLVFNEQLLIEYVNDAFFEACGLPRAERMHGKTIHHAIEGIYLNAEWQEEGDQSLEEKLCLLFERGSEATLEFGTRDGKSIIAVSRNLTGGKTLVTFADISALREQEREITQTQRQLENIGQYMQDAARVMSQGLFVVEDGVIILSNTAAADIMCLPPEIVAPGQRWTAAYACCVERGDFGDPANARSVVKGWLETLRANGSLTTSFLAGGKAWVQVVATLSERGHIMVVFNDLTEMKQREEELERLLARSEAADRAKTDFLANMGHEIRTPMNGVLGMAELLAKTDLDARQRTFTEIITKSASTLLTIFNDILDFSKIDAGQLKLKPAPFDPLEALEDVCSLHGAAASEKNIELIVRSAKTMPRKVVGDAGRFRQIVSNFVSNAIRHTEQGHVLVDMASTPVEHGQVTLTVRVEDTGIGLDPLKLSTIFEKFSHGGASENRHSEGTGLGLAITSGLVTLFGGKLEVASERGVGSTFTVHLPLPVIDVADATRPVPILVRGSRILVIDDNEISREILVGHLETWGFDCCAADSGPAARLILDAAREMDVPVDAVLMDYHLPGMDGAELCREIRADDENDGLALILLTSLDAAADMTLFEDLQVQAHLTKPVRANILRNTVIEVLRARHARRQAGDRLETINAFAARLPSLELELPDAPDSVLDGLEDRRVRIVVAEDNEVNAIVFSQILKAGGYSFALAANGEEAIALWQKHEPEVILMDVSMPVMDGLEATRRIRHMERVADMPPVAIIAVTSHDTPSGRELCLAHGMDDYLSKPVSPEMLEEKLARWLHEAQKSGSN